eukprot:TRINITY_DN75941_c0_g1_i1.p1 TRINITY_DN75941_c0_g1~~TRINITY_DN75941_c0_g1_i1.p1  ORF type:complete len:332 (-),score=48.28 TRINITY_DN75941_c0_g1_i1:182-1066(-)
MPARVKRQGDRFQQFGKTKMCKFEILGMCTKGQQCPFAHDKLELKPIPDLSRTKICKVLLQKGTCDVSACKYAHTKEELRATGTFHKTKLCRFSTHCALGAKCNFAHSEKEIGVSPTANALALAVTSPSFPVPTSIASEAMSGAQIPTVCSDAIEGNVGVMPAAVNKSRLSHVFGDSPAYVTLLDRGCRASQSLRPITSAAARLNYLDYNSGDSDESVNVDPSASSSVGPEEDLQWSGFSGSAACLPQGIRHHDDKTSDATIARQLFGAHKNAGGSVILRKKVYDVARFCDPLR